MHTPHRTKYVNFNIDGLVQERRTAIANLEPQKRQSNNLEIELLYFAQTHQNQNKEFVTGV